MNNFVELVNMLGRPYNTIGTIPAGGIDTARKLVTLTLLSGETITVKQSITVSVGDRCLVRDGNLISILPSLALYNETIY